MNLLIIIKLILVWKGIYSGKLNYVFQFYTYIPFDYDIDINLFILIY